MQNYNPPDPLLRRLTFRHLHSNNHLLMLMILHRTLLFQVAGTPRSGQPHCGLLAQFYHALWHCGIVAFWHCGFVALWHCGIVALWHCCIVALWHCGIVASWYCGIVALRAMTLSTVFTSCWDTRIRPTISQIIGAPFTMCPCATPTLQQSTRCLPILRRHRPNLRHPLWQPRVELMNPPGRLLS